MTKIIQFVTHSDPRGSLTVIEKKVPFEIGVAMEGHDSTVSAEIKRVDGAC